MNAVFVVVLRRHGTDCQLMALTFPEEKEGQPCAKPEYKKICCFYFPGHVISVYLLNPIRRLLSAYIWIPSTSSLGLYVLLDWTIPLYVYINTGIPCVSCLFSNIHMKSLCIDMAMLSIRNHCVNGLVLVTIPTILSSTRRKKKAASNTFTLTTSSRTSLLLYHRRMIPRSLFLLHEL